MLRPTVGKRDLTAPEHSEEWYPGDRRHFKGDGEELFGDYLQRQNLVQPIAGAKPRPTIGKRDLSAAEHSEEWFPGDRRHFKGDGEELFGDYLSRKSNLVQPIAGALPRPTIGNRDESAPEHSEEWYPGDRRVMKGDGEE